MSGVFKYLQVSYACFLTFIIEKFNSHNFAKTWGQWGQELSVQWDIKIESYLRYNFSTKFMLHVSIKLNWHTYINNCNIIGPLKRHTNSWGNLINLLLYIVSFMKQSCFKARTYVINEFILISLRVNYPNSNFWMFRYWSLKMVSGCAHLVSGGSAGSAACRVHHLLWDKRGQTRQCHRVSDCTMGKCTDFLT